MANFLYKTKGNTDPKGKPRVYFTCHPADFERYFEKILADIFKTHDCAVYYTEDMAQPMDEAELEVGLGQMNLFVVPVTFRLLSQPNRAMDGDIAYAKQENIPILPFMMEAGIDEIYSKPDKFGQRQYLNPCSTDLTEISYESKLKKYLDSVLVSDEMAKRVRAAFDAYIFLSYRKKDRKYANELMKLIHKNPELRDIAIWYDEFLTPGESFVDSIQKALAGSKLFALLVTPNLLEEPDGQPNFVMAEEYPAAVKAEKLVLPAEMVPTDHGALAEKFPSIPDCADPQDDTTFKERLLQSLQKIAVTANDHDPEHNFLIGRAYLEGIDVEVDRQRGLELITLAAEADLPEALKKLYTIYREGDGVAVDFDKALELAKRMYQNTLQQYGNEHPHTIDAICLLAQNYVDTWLRPDHSAKAEKLYQEAYALVGKVYGDKHQRRIEILFSLANLYDRGIVNGKAVTCWERAYEMQCELLGEEDPKTISILEKIASFYSDEELFVDDIKAVGLWEKLHALQSKRYGADSPAACKSEKMLTTLRARMSEEQRDIASCDKQYRAAKELQGEDHPDTVNAKRLLAQAYAKQGNDKEALRLYEEILSQQCRVLGKYHPQITRSLKDLCVVYARNQNLLQMAEMLEKFFFSEGMPDISEDEELLEYIRAVPGVYMMLQMFDKAVFWAERVYMLISRTSGRFSHEAYRAWEDLSRMYMLADDWDAYFEITECIYETYSFQKGLAHKDTSRIRNTLCEYYQKRGRGEKAVEMMERAYVEYCGEFGEDDGRTVDISYRLAMFYASQEQYQKAGALLIEVWKKRCRQLSGFHEHSKEAQNALKHCLENMTGQPGYGALLEKYTAMLAEIKDQKSIEAAIAMARQAQEDGEHLKAVMLLEGIYETLLIQGNADTMTAIEVLEMLVQDYQEIGEKEKTAETYQQIYTLRCKLQGQEHEDTVATLASLAHAYKQLKDYPKAAERYELLYTCRCKLLGKEHRNTLLALYKQAYCHGEMGNHQKAAELYEQEYLSECHIQGAEDPDTLITLHAMAYQYGEMDDHEKAIELYQQAYDSRCKVLGESHPKTLVTLNNLAYHHGQVGNHQRSKEMYETVYILRCKTLGENHPDTENAKRNLGYAQKRCEGTE